MLPATRLPLREPPASTSMNASWLPITILHTHQGRLSAYLETLPPMRVCLPDQHSSPRLSPPSQACLTPGISAPLRTPPPPSLASFWVPRRQVGFHTPARTLKVCIKALTGFSHVFSPDGLSLQELTVSCPVTYQCDPGKLVRDMAGHRLWHRRSQRKNWVSLNHSRRKIYRVLDLKNITLQYYLNTSLATLARPVSAFPL